ncbi:hypothetical protein LQ567_16180 [Niabella pedocola]|uniref:Uncharacterized protein n=1 Tax=Niabella pedocola TaxID=1752077 RepID=A0ABS8PTD2_9BACT|nr:MULTISPECIES: hypothetical protein [Niabella]MBZ4189319.1 hypothetical protein [Niabella beijingensis]MCD2424318.1 hypothetical protein [Niabella pedocola]
MIRIKSLFVACGLLAVTAVVFAGKPRFVSGLYAYDGSQTVEIAGSYNTSNLVTTGGTGVQQAKITDRNGNSFDLYADDMHSTPLYSSPSW